MSALLRVVALVPLAAVVVSVVFNTVAYASATWGDARHAPVYPPSCPDPSAPRLAWRRGFALECAVTALLLLTAPLWLPAPPSTRRLGAGRNAIIVLGGTRHLLLVGLLRRRLRRAGWTGVHAIAAGGLGLERAALRLARIVDAIRGTAPTARIDLVAHGLGGLVVREYIRAAGGRGVGRVVTLGTPHQGTEALRGRLGDLILGVARPAAHLLKRLTIDDPAPRTSDCTSIYSTADALLVPARCGYHRGALNVELEGVGHFSLLFSRRVWELVVENLATADRFGEDQRPAPRPLEAS